MMMESEVRKKFQKKFPKRTIHWAVLHEGVWYILATGPDPMEGDLNPYFRVDDATGKIREFYILKNLELFGVVRKLAEKKLG